MREKLSFIISLGLLFLSSTGVSSTDQETKQSMLEMANKISQIQEQEKNYHFQESKQLTETTNQLNEALKEIKASLVNLKIAPLPSLESIPVAPTTPSPQIATQIPSVTPPPQVLPVPYITVSVPEDLKLQIKNARYQSLIGIFFSSFSIFFIILALVYNQKKQDKMRHTLWKTEVDNLREEVVQKRPLLKIQSYGDMLALVNSGNASADEVRVFLGTAPTTMKQKLKTATKINVGEKTPLDLPVTLREEPLYATLEYKNSHSGRIYKDQFVLQSDELTGQTVSQHTLS